MHLINNILAGIMTGRGECDVLRLCGATGRGQSSHQTLPNNTNIYLAGAISNGH